MSIDKDLIQLLSTQVDKLQQTISQKDLRIEPHLYPKGLFQAQSGRTRFNAQAYLDELRHDLAQLLASDGLSEGCRQHMAHCLSQKVNVLVACFKSQHLRKRRENPMQALLEKIEARDQTIVDYFFDKDEE